MQEKMLNSRYRENDKNEIVVYQPEGGEFHIEVRVEKETVWLTQAQMAELFNATKQNISLHIANIFQEGELLHCSTVKESLTVQKEGKRNVSRKIMLYNLDVIISVGYRVKSIQGTRFRQWALQVLKDHLLKGYSVNQRLMLAEERIDQQLINHEQRIQEIDFHNTKTNNRLAHLEKQVDFFVKANLPPTEGAIPEKSWWSGYEFAAQLVRSATKEIIIIDPYADDVALRLIAKHKTGVNAVVYTARINQTLRKEVELMNKQKLNVELHNMQNVHDRFIIVDDSIYHLGTSINDIGHKLTAFSVLSFLTKEQLLGMVK